MYFADISNFNNVNDYISIFNGVIVSDLIIIFLVFNDFIKSKNLKDWYRTYNLSAVIADVFIIVIGIIISRFLYSFLFTKFSIILFTLLTLVIQIIHDILFYLYFSSVPKGENKMLDFFKKYADAVGYKAILGDSVLIIMSCLSSSLFASLSLNSNIIHLIVIIYFIPYLIYS
jgi:uncharacterized protein YacL